MNNEELWEMCICGDAHAYWKEAIATNRSRGSKYLCSMLRILVYVYLCGITCLSGPGLLKTCDHLMGYGRTSRMHIHNTSVQNSVLVHLGRIQESTNEDNSPKITTVVWFALPWFLLTVSPAWFSVSLSVPPIACYLYMLIRSFTGHIRNIQQIFEGTP